MGFGSKYAGHIMAGETWVSGTHLRPKVGASDLALAANGDAAAGLAAAGFAAAGLAAAGFAATCLLYTSDAADERK